jgi:transmembrane sensor
LIDKCLQGTASEKEMAELETWMAASDENRKYYQQLKNIHEASDTLAVVDEHQVGKALDRVLLASDRSRLHRVITLLQKVAAVMLLPLLAGSYFLGRTDQAEATYNKQLVYNEVSAAFGTRSLLTLSDGSKVWLNSGSKLKYPNTFEAKKREVFLTGEAYFEVKSNASSPFLVHTDNLTVKATGTEFNVNEALFEKKEMVTLVSGKVNVCKKDGLGLFSEIVTLKPDQHLSFDIATGDYEVKEEDAYKYIAWKDGKLVFRNDPMEEVIRKIGYFYRVEFELRDGALKEYRYRATFEEETVDEIMKLLKISSPIDYYEVRREPLPDGSFPKKKYIIYPKDN